MYTIAALLVSLATPTVTFNFPQAQVNALKDARLYTSQGGHADCLSGIASVFARGNNTRLLLGEPTSANQLSDYIQQYLTTDSNFLTRINGGPQTISGTYDIHVNLCVPHSGPVSNSTVQLLTHGLTLDATYWDLDPNYSYVDYAAANGYTTFSYDRLGSGNSSKPDPLQVVQAVLERETLHSLAVGLRNGSLGLGRYSKIIGVGHSYGSEVTNGLAGTHPSDFDAVILTGFSSNATAVPVTLALFNPTPIAPQRPDVFGTLPLGYFTPPSPAGEQIALYKYPNYNTTLANTLFNTRQPFSLGELVTQAVLFNPAPGFRGPVAIFDGTDDFIFCSGDCAYPTDQAALALQTLYPNRNSRGSRTELFEGIGHTINVHYEARMVFRAMRAFLMENGF